MVSLKALEFDETYSDLVLYIFNIQVLLLQEILEPSLSLLLLLFVRNHLKSTEFEKFKAFFHTVLAFIELY